MYFILKYNLTLSSLVFDSLNNNILVIRRYMKVQCFHAAQSF